jgi:predicted transcriptional regulator
MEIEIIKKSQREVTLEMGKLGKRSGVTNASITNRIQKIEERISGIEDIIEDIDTAFKENTKCKKYLTKNIQEIQDKMKRPNLRNRRERRFPKQRAKKHLQQNHRRKLP